ncbi:MAG: transcription termination/antitermination factor NusG [Clostridia bacterium]|nr:transcription termination/antitermination factor NusG [Clostridia bacterium]
MSDLDKQNEGMQWYVVHTYSGYENKVMINIQKIVENRGLGELIASVRIPAEKVVKVKNGEETEREVPLFPGYVLVEMVMNDETWHVVRNITGVTGFVGPGSKPTPLSEAEVIKLMGPEAVRIKKPAFKVGDFVEIINDEDFGGQYQGYQGPVTEIIENGQRLKMIVKRYGRDWPYEVDVKNVRLV